MRALQPATVVAGHAVPGASLDTSQVEYSLEYLQAFEQSLDMAATSGELVAAMRKKYPMALLGMALEIGAKVNKGEMKW